MVTCPHHPVSSYLGPGTKPGWTSLSTVPPARGWEGEVLRSCSTGPHVRRYSPGGERLAEEVGEFIS